MQSFIHKTSFDVDIYLQVPELSTCPPAACHRFSSRECCRQLENRIISSRLSSGITHVSTNNEYRFFLSLAKKNQTSKCYCADTRYNHSLLRYSFVINESAACFRWHCFFFFSFFVHCINRSYINPNCVYVTFYDNLHLNLYRLLNFCCVLYDFQRKI